MFGLGATLSNFLGQRIAEKFGYGASLTGSLVISLIPILIFGLLMPETLDARVNTENSGSSVATDEEPGTSESGAEVSKTNYVEMN